MSTDHCWTLVLPNGAFAENESGEPHFGTRADAARHAPEFAPDNDATPVQIDYVCVLVTCSACNILLGDEEESFTFHFPGRDEAMECARQAGWTVLVGSAWCDETDCAAAAKQAQEATAS